MSILGRYASMGLAVVVYFGRWGFSVIDAAVGGFSAFDAAVCGFFLMSG